MGAVNYTAKKGLKLLGSEVGAWLAEVDITDLSTTGVNLVEVGTVTQVAAATGSTVQAYNGFSVSDYFTRAYGADIDVNDTITLMAWFKTTTSGVETFCGNYTSGDHGGCMLRIQSGSVAMVTRDSIGLNKQATSVSSDYNDNNWHFAVGNVDSSGLISLYVDGILAATTAGANMDTTTGLFAVGARNTGADSFSGSLSQVKVDGTVLTASQVKTIYNSEKDMFKENSIFTQVGNDYDLDLSLSILNRSEDVKSNNRISLGGNQETVFQRADIMHNMTMANIQKVDLPEYRSFLQSVNGGETFKFDPYGSVATPDDPVDVIADGGHNETRINNSDYFTISMKVREV